MKKQFSDEQLDRVLTQAVQAEKLDDDLADQIADSPQLWWSVQSSIARGKPSNTMPWPPVHKIWRWLAVGVPAAAAVVIAATIFFGGRRSEHELVSNTPTRVENAVRITPPVAEERNISKPALSDVVEKAVPPVKAVDKNIRARRSHHKTIAKRDVKNAIEIKTDFIALSYALAPASGQIVRVKVPSSMMVSLGLVQAVERPTRLVDAEVVLGDDGMTHAIRFIRNQ